MPCRRSGGVNALQSAHPDIPIITAALDRELNGAYILPGSVMPATGFTAPTERVMPS